MSTGIAFLVVALAFMPPAVPPAQAPARDLKTIDVCRVVPGTAVATALEGTLSKATPFNDPRGSFARCTYLVAPKPGAGAPKGYTVWVYPPSDFDELRRYTEAPLTRVPGLGDAAESFVDPGDGRFKLRVLLRQDATLEITADTAAAARTLADLAARALRPGR